MQLRGVPGAVQKFLGPVPSIEKKSKLMATLFARRVDTHQESQHLRG